MKNENKNQVILILIVVIVILVCVCGALLLGRKTESSDKTYSEVGVYDFEKSDMTIPKFEINILGDYEGVINEEFLKEDGIQVYEFEGAIDNGWDVVTNHYVGVKLKDVIEKYQIKNFTSVDVKSLDMITVTYLSYEINDNMFIVFYKDKKTVTEDGRPMLLAIDYDSKFSLYDVIDMKFFTSASDKVVTDGVEVDKDLVNGKTGN